MRERLCWWCGRQKADRLRSINLAGQQEELSPWGGRECEADDVPRVILLNRGEGQHLGDPGPSRR
jgi:hypothetical protein